MSKAVCECGREFRVLVGYHDTPCLFPVGADWHEAGTDQLMLVCDLRCPSCKRLIGHSVMTGPSEITGCWKLFDELFQADQQTLSVMLMTQLLPLIKRYEVATRRMTKLQKMMLEVDKHLQDLHKRFRRVGKQQQ